VSAKIRGYAELHDGFEWAGAVVRAKRQRQGRVNRTNSPRERDRNRRRPKRLMQPSSKLRASRLALDEQQSWDRLVSRLPARVKRILEPVLAELASDLYTALVDAGSSDERDRLTRKFRIAAVVELFRCLWESFRGRLRDELAWVSGKLTRR
jgi:hypothetical protein